jgi:hypothetical protein
VESHLQTSKTFCCSWLSDRPSITGMVSSVDEHFCQYVASTRVQEARTVETGSTPAAAGCANGRSATESPTTEQEAERH